MCVMVVKNPVLFECMEKLALEAQLSPTFETQAHLSPSVQGPLAADGMVSWLYDSQWERDSETVQE